jgi:hypothetical protein
MTPEAIRTELTKTPFEPFRIVMTDGKTYAIQERDRDFVQVGHRTVVIFQRVNDNDPFFDRYEVASLTHVMRLEPIIRLQPSG